MEVGRVNESSSFCNLKAGNRRIDSSGKKEHGFSVCAKRHTEKPRNDFSVNIDELSDFYAKLYIGIMDIHSSIREVLQNAVSKLHFNFRRSHRIGLFRASGLDLKAYGTVTVSGAEVGEYSLFQIGIFCGIGNLHHRGNAGDAENM